MIDAELQAVQNRWSGKLAKFKLLMSGSLASASSLPRASGTHKGAGEFEKVFGCGSALEAWTTELRTILPVIRPFDRKSEKLALLRVSCLY